MELTSSFQDLLQQFSPVFTAPTYQTFVAIVAGWILSQRHRFITEVIFSSGSVGRRTLVAVPSLLQPRRLGHRHLLPVLGQAGGDDSRARARPSSGRLTTPCVASAGLTLYGAGMHYDPLISSRAKALVSWGHDWVVL